MTAYPEDEFYSGYVTSQARQAFEAGEISKESFAKIEQANPYKFYTPHFFIALALGLVTIIAVIFTGFLAWLFFNADSSLEISVLCIFMVAVCYFLLEWMVKRKKYFNAGVDNVLMVLILAFFAGIFVSNYEGTSWVLMNGTLMLVSLWLCLRFSDAFMAMVSCSFFLITFFLCFLKLGNAALASFPFVMMLAIGMLYFMINKLQYKAKLVYDKSIKVLAVFLLIALYASGNYWVTDQLQSSVTNAQSPVSFGWIFWIFTFVIPIVYIARGILKKDLTKVRTGLVLVAAIVFTYKYYFAWLPVEVEMLVAGLLLMALSFFLIQFLHSPHYGFTSVNTSHRPAWKDAEALVIAQTMGGVIKSSDDSSLMSGGSGGGGGASADF